MGFHNGENFEYFVNEEKRTVVAVLTVPMGIVGSEMLDIVNKASNSSFVFTDGHLGKGLAMKGRYEGKAVCHANDVWDVEKGKHLAKLRALRTYTKERAKAMHTVVEIFKNATERLERADRYSELSIKHIEEAIKNA